MCIPKVAALIRGRRLFETRRLQEEILYVHFGTLFMTIYNTNEI